MRARAGAGDGRGLPSRLAALIDASPVPILAYDRDGIVTLWSRAAERVFGWSDEEVLGRPLPIVPDDLQDEFRRIRDEVMQGRSFSGYETRRLRKDGSLIDVILSNAGVPGPTGAIEEIVALNQDITQRRQAEEALREAGERLRLKLSATRTGSWEWDIATNEVRWSENMGPQFGLPMGTVAPTYEAVLELFHPDDRPLLAEAVQRAVEKGEDYEIELRTVWPDGTVHWLAAQAHVQRDSSGRPVRVLGLSRDVTERRRLEEEVRASYEAAISAQQQAETLAQRLADVQRVTDVALARTSLDDLLHGLLSHVNTALKADTTTIFLLDEDQRFERRASLGSEDELTNRVLNTVGQSLVHRSVERFEPILLDDASGLGDLVLDARGIRSVAGVPLLVEGRIVGVLCVGHLETSAFSGDDVRLLQLVADRAALAIENARLYEQERNVAEILQRSLIPKRLPKVEGAALAARYVAAGTGMEVGGDWYDAVELPDGRLALTIGDVVGHGVDSAAGMGQIRSALRAYALDGHGPAGVLRRLNRLVYVLGEGVMTTLVYLVLDPVVGSVTFARAGHLPPLLVRPGGGAAFLDGGEALPLGVLPDAPYTDAEATLEPGSTVVLYTDGLVERRDASLDDGLANLVVAASEAAPSADALVDRLLGALVGADGPDDDVALLALRLAATPPERLELRLAADPTALARLRRALGRFLQPANVSETEAYEITVACGEAAANAIAHARTDGDAHFDSRRPAFGRGHRDRRARLRPLEAAGRRRSRLRPPAHGEAHGQRRDTPGRERDRGEHAPQAARAARAPVSAVAPPLACLSGRFPA